MHESGGVVLWGHVTNKYISLSADVDTTLGKVLT